jgi:hypothetical protein
MLLPAPGRFSTMHRLAEAIGKLLSISRRERYRSVRPAAVRARTGSACSDSPGAKAAEVKQPMDGIGGCSKQRTDCVDHVLGFP